MGVMSSPTANSSRPERNHAAEYSLSFPFPVTWACLLGRPLRPVPSPVAPVGAEIAPAGQNRNASKSAAQWEMVIPKMARPGRARPQPPAPAAIESAAADKLDFTPSFSPAPARLPITLRPALITAAAVGVLLGVAIWLGQGNQPQQVSEPPSALQAGWVRERSQFFPMDSGFQRERQILLYRGSKDQSDYRLQFDWRLDSNGVGWVYRVRDVANYYAARIKIEEPGSPPVFRIEHFAVIGGREGQHTWKTGSFTRNDPVIRVSMEAAGSAFALNVQGIRAANWTDARLPSGGLGFFKESNQQPAVEAVQLSFSLPGRDFQGSFKDLTGLLP
jgi:hypothetical protein